VTRKQSLMMKPKKLISRANDEINRQKNAALDELKKEVANFSLQIAEKLVGKALESSDAQKALIADQLGRLDNQQKASA